MKFLNAGTFYKANCIILGGDLTFKAIVPIVKKSEKFYATFLGEKYILSAEEEVKLLEKRIRSVGFHPYRLNEDQMDEFIANPNKQNELFLELVVEMIKRWIALAEDKLKGTGIRCFISPGNDDDPEIDKYLKSSDYIICPEEKIVQLDENHEMVTLGVSNIIPWHCFRDVEEKLSRKNLKPLSPKLKIWKTAYSIYMFPHTVLHWIWLRSWMKT